MMGHCIGFHMKLKLADDLANMHCCPENSKIIFEILFSAFVCSAYIILYYQYK